MKEVQSALNKIEDKLSSIDNTLVRQEENLKEHMRRTDILEKEFKPVKSHVDQVRGAGKLIALASLIAGIVSVLIKVV